MRSRPSVTGSIDLELPEFENPPRDPMPLLMAWVDRAEKLGVLEPYNIALATTDASGDVTNRFVLAKTFDNDGMLFATNTSSAKGKQMTMNARVAVALYWVETRQQLRITGEVHVATTEESDAIWVDRSVESQAAATASPQSEPLTDVEDYLANTARLAAPGVALPRPEDWNGYRLRPDTIEFWHGSANRMHRRLRYDRHDGDWTNERLYP